MDGTTVSALTEALMNILIGSFSVLILTWAIVGVQNIVNERRDNKRKDEADARDREYHEKRMKDLK